MVHSLPPISITRCPNYYHYVSSETLALIRRLLENMLLIAERAPVDTRSSIFAMHSSRIFDRCSSGLAASVLLIFLILVNFLLSWPLLRPFAANGVLPGASQ